MGTRTIRAIAAAVLLSAGASTVLAQNASASPSAQASFTAGQGGLMQAPVRPTQTFYSFTGDVDARVRAQRSWQHAAGPRLRVGQAEITLPSAR
jgi:hypothetical protein